MTRGERNVAWIERYCRIPEGRFVGQPVRLRGWQQDIVLDIYDTPTRRAIISMGRKNAKTALSAFLLLLHLVGPEARPNSQLESTAQSQEQAAVLYALAAKIVRMSPDLSQEVTPRDTVKELHCRELGTLYRALSAEAKTAFGHSPVFLVHDELGQVRGPRFSLYEATETGCAAHENPLSVVISTQAATDADLLSVLIDDAKTRSDPRVKLHLFTAPVELDPFSEEAIRAANPAFGDFQSADEVLAMAQDAKRMPSREADYRNLVLNQRIEASSPFVSPSVWKANGGQPRPLRGKVYAGLDLSETADLTALVAVAWDDGWDVDCTFWLPGLGLAEKARKDRVPYDLWARQEPPALETTPGRAIEYQFVAHRLRRFFNGNEVAGVAFDRHNWKHLRPWLEKAGFTEAELALFVEFGQGFVSMSPALRTLEAALLEERLRHGNHPVLTMCAANAVVVRDPAGNRKLAKDRSRGRIDGMVSLAMAMSIAETGTGPTRSIFDREELWAS